MVTNILKKALDFLFPDGCLFCGSSDGPICEECTFYLKRLLSFPRCTLCGRPFWGSTEDHPCEACERDNPYHLGLFFSFPYTDRTKNALLRFKYAGDFSILEVLPSFVPDIPQVDAVVPVPLYPSKLRRRGFNQAAVLARRISNLTGASLLLFAVSRVKDTGTLTGLGSRRRKEVIKGAFRVNKRGVFRGKRVLLVDDVYTTGSTFRELSKVVKKEGGAEAIYLYTLFRTF